MQNFYLSSINGKKRKYPLIYKALQIEIFGKHLTWKEMQEQENDKLITMMCALSDRIALYESPLDVKKLARAIQHTRSGIGGCAITKYICRFCGSEESWGNTATPGICGNCATTMAENMAKHSSDILKDEVKESLQINIVKLKEDLNNLLKYDSKKAGIDDKKSLMHAGSKITLELILKELETGAYNYKK